jgi:DNA-binding NarL/FixJ family response regulator
MTHPPIRLLVDHEDILLQAGLAALLARCSDLELTHDRAHEALDVDVVVTDYAAGLRRARERAAHRRSPRVVVLTRRDSEVDIRCALAQGIDGYMIVGCPVDSIADAARAVHHGLRHLDPVATHRIAESMFHEPLTGRETQVLQLVATGCANKVIAARLQIGIGTVKTHMRSLLDKLDVASRTEAAAVAHRRGLLRETTLAVAN